MVIDTLAVESNFEKAINLVGTDLFEGGEIALFADAMEGSDTISISGQTDITNMHLTVKTHGTQRQRNIHRSDPGRL